MLPPAEQAFSDIQVPASFSALMEYRRPGWPGCPRAAIHVPHYLAQAEYAQGALVGHQPAGPGLHRARPRHRRAGVSGSGELAQIGSELAGNDEATALVAALERQYDAFQRGRELPGLLATDVGPVPSADEIGAELRPTSGRRHRRPAGDRRAGLTAQGEDPRDGAPLPDDATSPPDHRWTMAISATKRTASVPAQRRAESRGADHRGDLLGPGLGRVDEQRSSCRQRTTCASEGATACRTVAAQALNNSAADPWTTALRA